MPFRTLLPLLMVGCVTATQGFYYKNNQRADATQTLLADLQQDKQICVGKSAAARMSATMPAIDQPQFTQYVFEGCMAERGWQIRPK